MTNKPQNMQPMEIRIALIRAGVTQAELARELDVTQQLVYKIIAGTSVSHQVRQHIAKRIGIDIKRIWPDPYLYFGGPRKAGRPVCDGQRRVA
jgi:lambda repressor-like predicted transcriptional regulator